MGRFIVGHIAFSGHGNQHLILFSGEIKNLRAPAVVKLGEHIIENHNRLQSQPVTHYFEQCHFQGQRHRPHLAVRSELAGGNTAQLKVHVIALRTDKVHAASHFTGVDALEMLADLRMRIVEHQHFVE